MQQGEQDLGRAGVLRGRFRPGLELTEIDSVVIGVLWNRVEAEANEPLQEHVALVPVLISEQGRSLPPEGLRGRVVLADGHLRVDWLNLCCGRYDVKFARI